MAFFQKLKHELVETLARWAGRQVYNRRLLWLVDRSWMAPYAKYLEVDRVGRHPATRILDRRFTLINLAKSVRRLRGSTAECGVFRGVSSAMICKALEGAYQEGENHYGFDSFAGLPEPTGRDHEAPKVHVWEAGDLSASLEETRKSLTDFPQCRLIQGWIPACFAGLENTRFRLVHIDVDLDVPTQDCLKFFYPRMVDGGILVFDDYGFASCPGARKAIDEFFQSRPEPVYELASGQAFAVKAPA